MDIKNYYIEKGSGEPLVLLHGNGESSEYFTAQIEYFSKKYRVIAIDTRGHGKSPRGKAPFTIHQFADDLLDFFDELGIERANILGFSDGGNIAIIFALKYPERVAKLVLNGANINVGGMKLPVRIAAEAGYYISKLFFSIFRILRLGDSLEERAGSLIGNAKKKMELFALMVKYPAIDAKYLARITVPVLVIAGNRDMIKEKHTRLIHRSIIGSRLAIIRGSHFVASENPKEFNYKVDEFLEDANRADGV